MFTNMFTNDVQQQALSFLVSQQAYIEPAVYRIRHPDLNYRELVPIDTSAPPWVKVISFYSIDQVGKADWFNHLARDVPLADITRGRFEIAVEMAAVGYRYTTEELQHAMMVGFALGTERAAAAKRAAEEFIYSAILYGATVKNWLGLLNHTLPTVSNAPQTWAYQVANNGTTQIMQDINAALANIHQSTAGVEMANTILLPLGSMNVLAMTQLPNTSMNLLEWIRRNNVYTQTTGGDLVIRGIRGLDIAGAAGQSRMVIYRRDPEILKVHIPMPHQFLDVWRTSVMVYDVPGIFRMSPLEIRRPMAIRYVDGI